MKLVTIKSILFMAVSVKNLVSVRIAKLKGGWKLKFQLKWSATLEIAKAVLNKTKIRSLSCKVFTISTFGAMELAILASGQVGLGFLRSDLSASSYGIDFTGGGFHGYPLISKELTPSCRFLTKTGN